MSANKLLLVMIATWFSLQASAPGADTGTGAAWTQSLPVLERPAGPRELIAYPDDGKTVGVNPPGFCWTPEDKAKSYRLEVRKASSASRTVLSAQSLASTVYPVLRTLDAGDYLWQVVYLNSDGAAYGVSKTRRFKVPTGAAELPMPDVARLKARLARVRPRLFLAGSRLEKIREAAKAGKIAWWGPFIEAANAALEVESYREPGGYPGGKWTVADWRRIYTPGKVGGTHVARTALAYKITDDPKYLEGALRWILTLASWDPKGITSHGLRQPDGSEGDDEASMPMLERMSMGWDWIGDKLSPQERSKVLSAMTERGNQVLRLLHKQDFLSHPFSNHEGRVLAFLGLAGLSFLGDIPEAEQWLDYVLRCYLTSYPAWGSDEGGWAQGVSYWSGYVLYLSNFADALRQVTDTDIFRRPFYRNTGYLAVYFHPPYARRGAFGDGGETPPGEGEQELIDYFADAFQDPVLKWQAESIPVPPPSRAKTPWHEWAMEDVVAVLRAKTTKTQARPPADLDGSRYLSDIGWVAMHAALGDRQNDVWALFKSSRFGSFSHSHADQNTFQLNAYGQALLIDSGYYPWYGSPHDGLWTRQTRAHNGILVNGRGQPPHTWAAGGQIESFERRGLITVARGQAAGAYNLPQTEGIIRQWRESLKEPIPPLEPKVENFQRTLAFVASKSRPILIVQDYLRTADPATFDWLLHALNQMRAEDRTGAITISNGEARLAVRLVSTRPFRFSQQNEFPVPPEDRAAAFPNQWHLKARTEAPAEEIKFLAVMVPYKASEKEPEIVPLESTDAVGFRVAGSRIAAWWGRGARGQISLDGLTGDGRLVVTTVENGKAETVVSP